MSEYISIRADVLQKIAEKLPEIQERFSIETLGIFGSVARGTDTPESDVDVLYTFSSDCDTYDRYFDFSEYLEELFGRKVDLVSPEYLKPRIRPYVMKDAIMCVVGTA